MFLDHHFEEFFSKHLGPVYASILARQLGFSSLIRCSFNTCHQFCTTLTITEVCMVNSKIVQRLETRVHVQCQSRGGISSPCN
ncbi:ORF49 [White spot syndrome virus]|uniref:ORF49 n=1 Tax=White spot syndrome virus TaxID=342409 RepID=A0A2D3I5W5_9VIRU|nr:ORF49 [White spot syndrome virus]